MNKKLKLEELNRISIDEFKVASKLPVVIVLNNIRSLQNIGSVFRTADAFRCKEIWLQGITAKPPHRDIQKSALGATNSVTWRYLKTESEVFELAEKGTGNPRSWRMSQDVAARQFSLSRATGNRSKRCMARKEKLTK